MRCCDKPFLPHALSCMVEPDGNLNERGKLQHAFHATGIGQAVRLYLHQCESKHFDEQVVWGNSEADTSHLHTGTESPAMHNLHW